MIEMALTKEYVIKEGPMVKRSQNKKIYTLVNNYKERWFVLNREFLIYYDTEVEEVSYVFFSLIHIFIAEYLNFLRFLIDSILFFSIIQMQRVFLVDYNY